MKKKVFGRFGRKGKSEKPNQSMSNKEKAKFFEKRTTAKEKLQAKKWLRNRRWPKK